MHPNGAEYNQYASAITAIGNIIEYYDHDKVLLLIYLFFAPYKINYIHTTHNIF